MAQFNVANQSFYTSNKSIAEVVMIANSSGSIINSFSGSGGGNGSTLSETLWTDDSNNYYIRIDNGTNITWATPMGVSTTAPLTAASIRPAAGASIILDTSRYQATVLRVSDIAIGDYLSHVVTADPTTGVVITTFWLNVTQNTKLATPPVAANITPISPLPANAAQETGGNLAAILSSLQTNAPVGAFGTQIIQSDSTPFTPGTKGTAFICSVAGVAKVSLGSVNFLLPLQVGYNQFPLLLTQVWLTGTTAVFTSYPV